MEIRISNKMYLPERAWIDTLIHEMVHVACYWNGLWCGKGHDGWFVDLADEIRGASGGEFSIQQFVDKESLFDKEDVEAESLVPGEDYGFALAARLGYDGRQFKNMSSAGAEDPLLCLGGWCGVNTVLWRCATLEEAKAGIAKLRDLFREPFRVDGNAPAVRFNGKRIKFMPRVVGFAIYELNRNNVPDRSNRKVVRREFSKLAPLPRLFPAPMQGKDEIRTGQTLLADEKYANAGVVVKIWDSNGGWTSEYRNRPKSTIFESFAGNAFRSAGRGIRKIVGGIENAIRSVLRSLWGEPEVRDYGDGHVDLAIP